MIWCEFDTWKVGRVLETRKFIKIFLGSPNDLAEERKEASVIVNELNDNHARRSGYQIELVKWENPRFYPQKRRPQDVINEGLKECDYFVGMLWKKWGTSPRSREHHYTSGFEEEYEEATKLHVITGKPGISLILKEIPEILLSDRGDDIKEVVAFREKVYSTEQFCGTFRDSKEFSIVFRAIIANVLEDQKESDHLSATLEFQKTKPEPELPSTLEFRDSRSEDQKGLAQSNGESPSGVFDANATTFIQDFIQKEHDGNNSTYSAPEVARFRLLASCVSQTGNDNSLLGVHDANLIYRYLRDDKLSTREIRRLVSTAVENLESSTVPLWHWIFLPNYKIDIMLPFLTLVGEEKRRRSAFNLLGMLAIVPRDFKSRFDRKFRDYWFSETLSDDLVISALEYLGIVGDEGLRMDWDRFIGSSNINVSRAAVRSLARIKSRVSKVDALRFVAKHETIDIGSELAGDLLSGISSIGAEVLRECLNHRTRDFTQAIAAYLLEQDALGESDARLLCKSVEADIRLIGARALVRLYPEMDLFDVRKILVKPEKLSPLRELISELDGSYTHPGTSEFIEYKVGVFSGMSYEELVDVQRTEKLNETEATIALYRNHYTRVTKDLEKNLLDGFEGFCTSRRDDLPDRGSRGELSIHIRSELVQSALEAFCSNAGGLELITVREVLDQHDLRFSTELISFIAKHGEWEDVARVIRLSETIQKRSLYTVHSVAYQLTARTLLKLAEKRVTDVWNLDLPGQVRIQLVLQMSKIQFTELDEQYVVSMLRWDDDVVRAVVTLRAIQCLPKERIREILNNYWDAGDVPYYNVIFWLDLGVSADPDTSRAITLNVLSKIT